MSFFARGPEKILRLRGGVLFRLIRPDVLDRKGRCSVLRTRLQGHTVLVVGSHPRS